MTRRSATTGKGGRGRRPEERSRGSGTLGGWLGYLLALLLLLACVALAVIGWRQAAALTAYLPKAERAADAAVPSWQRLWTGEPAPWPQDERDPSAIKAQFEVERIHLTEQAALSAWRIRRQDAPGVVLLFADQGESRSALLPVAKGLLSLGWEVLVVGTAEPAAGRGPRLSLGWHESAHVRATYDRERLRRDDAIVLYGRGASAAAILRMLHTTDVAPNALILERPFDSLRSRMQHRSAQRGLPPVPLGAISAFWFGLLADLPAFEYLPAQWAREVKVPALVLAVGGERAAVSSARKVHDGLAGRRMWRKLAAAPAASVPAAWTAATGELLTLIVTSPGSASAVAESVR